ncbi:hypothetical protein AVEN_7549-1 [Araneus ventricosus]|uniref:Uncharacterized protein n=2 Tax=Araneus ventricosus TaxID=182803 RepID=A0A4Y2IXR1_ARAVE|nr:hypothetical protein AVEN_7549-1 [Araneus ventricosus]
MWNLLQVVERNATWLMRRPGSVHKTGGFRLSGGVESWTSPTLVSVKFWLRIETRQYSHQGLRVLIFTDRPGPRAHLVGVYIELRNLIVFSSAVQVGSRNYLTTRPRVTVPPFEVIFIDFCT